MTPEVLFAWVAAFLIAGSVVLGVFYGLPLFLLNLLVVASQFAGVFTGGRILRRVEDAEIRYRQLLDVWFRELPGTGGNFRTPVPATDGGRVVAFESCVVENEERTREEGGDA